MSEENAVSVQAESVIDVIMRKLDYLNDKINQIDLKLEVLSNTEDFYHDTCMSTDDVCEDSITALNFLNYYYPTDADYERIDANGRLSALNECQNGQTT